MRQIGQWLSSSVWFGIAGIGAVLALVIALWVRWYPPRATPVEGIEETFPLSDREAFLARVWSQRIINGLYQSLEHAVELQLDLTNAPDLVTLFYAQTTVKQGESISLRQAYMQSGQQLLIVGAPGSGKTTEALKLMRRLIEDARTDPTSPVPEIFPLASWKVGDDLTQWLAEQLRTRHGGRVSMWMARIRAKRLVPILDGLDEVAPEHRERCVREINRFWEAQGLAPIVLCCRMEEYKRLAQGVKFGGAVIVCPPGDSQIQTYLSKAGPHWAPVIAEICTGSNSTLRSLLSTPLMLSVAVLAYQNQNAEELLMDIEEGTLQNRLWSRYVSEMSLGTANPLGSLTQVSERRYAESDIIRWLAGIAFVMAENHETEFWLHEWFGDVVFYFFIKAALTAAVIIAVVLAFGLPHVLLGPPDPGLPFAIFLAISGAFSVFFVVNWRPKYRKQFNGRRFWRRLLLTLGVGTTLGAGLGLVSHYLTAHTVPSPIPSIPQYVIVGALLFLFFSVPVGILIGLRENLVGTVSDQPSLAAVSPKDVLRNSGRTGLVLAIPWALVAWLFQWSLINSHLINSHRIDLLLALLVALPAAVVTEFVVALMLGLGSPLFHYVFRRWLQSQGYAPRQWEEFLEWASHHLLLRSTGPSYEGTHSELRDYLARQHEPFGSPGLLERLHRRLEDWLLRALHLTKNMS